MKNIEEKVVLVTRACPYGIILLTPSEWNQNIISRNNAVLSGETSDYFIDNGILEKLNFLFETPGKEDIDVWYVNHVKK